MDKKLIFVGAGSMSEAIISGILNAKFTSNHDLYVTNKNNKDRLEFLQKKYGIHYFKDKKMITEGDIIILATKPYDMKDAIKVIRDYVTPNQLIISVIAGKSTNTILELFGKDLAIVRAMPNTSSSIGYSATAISGGKYAKEEHIDIAKSLFETIGTTAIVEESKLHAVTGVSGSGPAYIYYLVEAMEKAAVEAGLDVKIAQELITQTVIGAGKMLQSSGETAEELREKVTSKKGTTEAGIETLKKYEFEKAVMECVKSAKDRSVELGKLD